MGHPVSSEPPASKSSKRKGTRSVSTLTPSQLARKRANDREAQRAIRARTKEHIDRLERELEELRSHQNRDRTLQDLLRRNKALEDELSRLRESMGMSMASSPYSAAAPYDEQHHAAGAPGTVPSPRMSPLAASADYNPLPDYGQHYVPMSGSNVDSWAANVPSHIGSNVSSPSSSADDYVSGYIPTSVPASMMPTSNSLESIDDFRMGNMQIPGVSPNVYMQQQQQQQQQHHQHQHQQPQQGSSQGDWPPVYPVYYNSQMPKGSEACLSR